MLTQYKSLFLQLKWPKMAGGIKIYTNLAMCTKKHDYFQSQVRQPPLHHFGFGSLLLVAVYLCV